MMIFQEHFKIRTTVRNDPLHWKAEYSTNNIYSVAQCKNYCKSSYRAWSLGICSYLTDVYILYEAEIK